MKTSAVSYDIDNPRIWHTAQMRVPLYEVDIGQAVYHGNYYHLFELGREAFLRDMGHPYRRLMDRRLHLTIVEAHCNYRRPLRYDDPIDIRTCVLWKRSRSLAFLHQIHRLEEGKDEPVFCTKAVLNMVCVHFSGQARVLPEDFVEALERWIQRE